MVEPSGGQGEANSTELRLGFANLRLERSDPRDRFDLLLGVVADFSLEMGNQPLYSEPDFPVVELS